MDAQKLQSLATILDQLSNNYTSGAIKHHQYVVEYDNVLKQHGITIKELMILLKTRRRT